MSVLSRLKVKSNDGFVELSADDLTLKLGECEARNILEWLEQAIHTSLLFLLKVDCPGFEIEGRNYDDYLDFLVFVHNDGEMSARTFIVPKTQASSFFQELDRAVATAFA